MTQAETRATSRNSMRKREKERTEIPQQSLHPGGGMGHLRHNKFSSLDVEGARKPESEKRLEKQVVTRLCDMGSNARVLSFFSKHGKSTSVRGCSIYM